MTENYKTWLINRFNFNNNGIKWINIAKFFAISGVIINHLRNILYEDINFRNVFAYAVPLFIIVMGTTTYLSYERHNDNFIKHVVRKIYNIFIPYLIATPICFTINNYGFDTKSVLASIIHFDANGPFYYVFLYIQLSLISPVVYLMLNNKYIKNQIINLIFNGFIFLTLSIISVKIGAVFNSNLSANYLFGGTYLFLFYLGMLIGKYRNCVPISKVQNRICILVSISLIVIWSIYIYRNGFVLDKMIGICDGNIMPFAVSTISAVLFILLSYGLGNIKINNIVINKIENVILYVGKHTLYIFLYHYVIVQYILSWINYYSLFKNTNFIIGIIITLAITEVFCLLIELAIESARYIFKQIIKIDNH